MKRRSRRFALAVCSSAVALAALAQGPELDEQRSAWSFRRSVGVTRTSGSLAAFGLPPEVLARCQPGARDVRIVEPEGREVAYLIDRSVARETESRFGGVLVDARRELRGQSAWTADLGRMATFDRLTLAIPAQDFSKAVRVEVSPDRARWREALRDASVFDRPWRGGRIHHTSLALAAPVEARYVRVTTSDSRSRPIDVTGLEAIASRLREEGTWWRDATLVPLEGEPGRSRYRIEGVAGMPFEKLRIETEDAFFSRRVTVSEARSQPGRDDPLPLGSADVYRVRVDDALLAGESLEIPLRAPGVGELVLEIDEADSPPLRRLRIRVGAVTTRLVFAPAAAEATLYYGNPVTRPARYDLERERARIANAAEVAEALLGPEQPNPRFRAPAPLAFAPLRGAILETRRWTLERPFEVPERDDLYSLALSASDLAVLRPDLADLRLVDAQDVQLPFVLDREASLERVVMEHSVERLAAGGEGRGAISRHDLALPETFAKGARLPVLALELQVSDRFFTRPARLLDPLADQAHGPSLLAAATLARSGREEGPSRPLELGLGSRRVSELRLEIEEGDNAPLNLEVVRALVPVPRLAFKAGPGRYRLLLGNEDAAAPRYDIAALRQEFLTYAALPLAASPLDKNPGHRRRLSEHFRGASPTLLLWGTLGFAVVALLLLTARIVAEGEKRPPPDGPAVPGGNARIDL